MGFVYVVEVVEHASGGQPSPQYVEVAVAAGRQEDNPRPRAGRVGRQVWDGPRWG